MSRYAAVGGDEKPHRDVIAAIEDSIATAWVAAESTGVVARFCQDSSKLPMCMSAPRSEVLLLECSPRHW
jgi:hypothetical protein